MNSNISHHLKSFVKAQKKIIKTIYLYFQQQHAFSNHWGHWFCDRIPIVMHGYNLPESKLRKLRRI